jgi:CheY-like chemotaxis protein
MEKRTLIVDDGDQIIEFVSAVLGEDGYITIGAADGTEDMEKVKTEKPDLILLDIMMPGKGGIAMYRDLRNDEDLPFNLTPSPILSVHAGGRSFQVVPFLIGV